MSSNQLNKKAVWDFRQAQESARAEDLPEVLKAVTARNIKWFGPDPINRLPDIESYIEDYWPLSLANNESRAVASQKQQTKELKSLNPTSQFPDNLT